MKDSEQRNNKSEKMKRNKKFPYKKGGKYRSIIFKDSSTGQKEN